MAREIRKAYAKGVNAVGDIIEVFADTYAINSKIEVTENLSEADIQGTEGKTLVEKADIVEGIFSKLKRK